MTKYKEYLANHNLEDSGETMLNFLSEGDCLWSNYSNLAKIALPDEGNYMLEVKFCTDGDFFVYSSDSSWETNDYEKWLTKKWNNKEAVMAATLDILDEFSRTFRTHCSYVERDFNAMLFDVINGVVKGEKIVGTMSGNYDGTFISFHHV